MITLLSGVWADYKFEQTENQTKLILPYNDISKNIYYNLRMVVSVPLPEPIVWRISKVEGLNSPGVIHYTLYQDLWNDHTDVIETNEDGKVVGMWADLLKESNLPPQDDSSSSTQLDDTYAEITYAGSKPQIKVGGSYKTITIQYYSNISEVVDQTPGTWEFYINDTDVSDYIKILETDNDNTIKIKFLGDEEYLGQILVIKNVRNEVTAELKLEITSL